MSDSTSESEPSRSPVPLRPVVTISSLYGGWGRFIGPRVAERLRVPFLDRAIPTAVARRAGIPETEVAEDEEVTRTVIDRMVATLARAPGITDATGAVERLDDEAHRIRAETEEFLVESAVAGGVVLGRGGQVVLAKVPGALHVRLGGPRERRVQQIMQVEQVDRKTAERRVDANERARRTYILETYGVDGQDPSLYHMMLDATALTVDACVELIVAAAQYRLEMAIEASGKQQ